MDDTNRLRHFAQAFVDSQVRTAVDRHVESLTSTNRSPGVDADSPAAPNVLELSSESSDYSTVKVQVSSDWIARIQTLVTEVLTTALQNTTAVLTDRNAYHRQHKSSDQHNHKQLQVTRESIQVVYTNILYQALARAVSHLCQAPPLSTTESTQELDFTEETLSDLEQSLSEPELPVELCTEDLPKQPEKLLQTELSINRLRHSHRHKHRHHHKKRARHVAENFYSDLLAAALLRISSRSYGSSPAVALDLDRPSRSPSDLDTEEAQPKEPSNGDPLGTSTEEPTANSEVAAKLDDSPSERCTRKKEAAIEPLEWKQLSVQEPVIATAPRNSSSDRKKRGGLAFDAESKRLRSSFAEIFVTELLSKAMTSPRLLEKALWSSGPSAYVEKPTSPLSAPERPPSAPERPAKGRPSPERKAKSREKESHPEVKSISPADSTSFALPPLILPQTRERTPPPSLEPSAVPIKEHRKKARSKDQVHQRSVPKSSNDITLELKFEKEAEVASYESPASITARAAAFIYQSRSAASLSGQPHPRRQDSLDPVKTISHSRDSPRAAMLANAKIPTLTPALLRPLVIPSPVVLPPSPTKERPKEKGSPVKSSSPTKKRSGFCQMCVLEGRSCKINDCLKHQLLK